MKLFYVYLLIAAILQFQILALLWLHGANLKVWDAQVELNEHVIYEIEELKYLEVSAEVTAYTADVAETDDRPWETASGETVREGIAACPARLKFGTKIEIDGRMLVCEDRMNPRLQMAENYDVYFASKSEAINFGRQNLTVKIYE